MPVSVSTLTRLLSCRYLLLLLVLLNNLFLLLVLIQSIYHSILLLALATYSTLVIAVLGLVGGGFYSLVYLLSVIIARHKLLYNLLLGNECTLAGKTKLPFGTIPLMLNCGEVTLQTPSGKVMSIVLESHTTHRAQDLTQTDVSTR